MSGFFKQLADLLAKQEQQPAQQPAPQPAPSVPNVGTTVPNSSTTVLDSATPAPQVAVPMPAAPVVEPNHAGEGPVDARGIPLFPWPIIVQRANSAQLASLSRDEEHRLNWWTDNIADGWMGGNLMANKFYRYKGLYDTKGGAYDWRGTVWEEIWKAYVKLPVPEFKAPDKGWEKMDEAYRARATGGAASQPEQAAPTPAPQAGDGEDVQVGS